MLRVSPVSLTFRHSHLLRTSGNYYMYAACNLQRQVAELKNENEFLRLKLREYNPSALIAVEKDMENYRNERAKNDGIVVLSLIAVFMCFLAYSSIEHRYLSGHW